MAYMIERNVTEMDGENGIRAVETATQNGLSCSGSSRGILVMT